MSVTLTLTRNVRASDTNRENNATTHVGDQLVLTDAVVLDGAADQLVPASLDVDKITMIYAICDQDIKIETNNGGAPDDTINLKANQPWIWETDSYYANLLTVDVTALYLTNDSGADAAFKMYVLQDDTPA